MVISVAKILELAVCRADLPPRSLAHLTILHSFQRACKVIESTVSGSSEVPIAAIQGPPGTGKTSLVVESLIRILEQNLRYDLIVYVAPTNNLVAEAATRTLEEIIRKYGRGRDFIKILERIRVLGSQISSYVDDREVEILEKLLDIGNTEPIKSVLRTMTSRSITISESERDFPYIVFTTEWVNVAIFFEREKGLKVAVFFDEASRSPLHRVFTPLASVLYKLACSSDVKINSIRDELEQEHNIKSLVVIGDPEQTISSKEYRDLYIYVGGRKSKLSWLALELAVHLLRRIGLIQDQFVMLDTTLRIPKLGERPISKGFYDNKLEAAVDLCQRLSESQLKDLYTCVDEVSEKLKKCCSKMSKVIDKVAKLIKESFDPNRPAPVAIMRTVSYKPSQEIELTRGVVGALIAVFLYHILPEVIQSNVTVGVISPYVAQVNFSRAIFRHILRKLDAGPRPEVSGKVSIEFKTVHSVLGCEFDFVIALLGKEYPYTERYGQPTIYCSQPEVLNVQLSRQRIQMYVIGNVTDLESCFSTNRLRSAKKTSNIDKVHDTAETLLEYATSGVYRMKFL